VTVKKLAITCFFNHGVCVHCVFCTFYHYIVCNILILQCTFRLSERVTFCILISVHSLSGAFLILFDYDYNVICPLPYVMYKLL